MMSPVASMILPLLLLLLLLPHSEAAQSNPVELWVDAANGSDANKGASKATALKTIIAAWAMVPESKKLTTEYRIIIAGGNFNSMTAPTYYANRLGSSIYPVTISAEVGPGGPVTLPPSSVFNCAQLTFVNITFQSITYLNKALPKPTMPTPKPSPSRDPSPKPLPSPSTAPSPVTPGGRVVGTGGPAAWDALSSVEKNLVKQIHSAFLHQSVGQDLEDGAEADGFKFEYIDSTATSIPAGLNGGLFSTSNGNPKEKVAEWRRMTLANQKQLRVTIMKFGYADVMADSRSIAQAEYEAAVLDIKAQGIRVLHITPPLVYKAPDENAPKMLMRQWMLSTFASDVIFDLEELESTDPTSGGRCERGGSWEICNSVRSTAGCQSQGQGVDAPSGQGHICLRPHAMRIAKAFLYAIAEAGK